MSYSLAIDTVSREPNITLFTDLKIIKVKEFGQIKSSGNLLGLIKDELDSENLIKNDLNDIVVCNGPGNFTGIRIGISLGQGISRSLGLMLTCLPLFGLLFFTSKTKGNRILLYEYKKNNYLLKYIEKDEKKKDLDFSQFENINLDALEKKIRDLDACELVGFSSVPTKTDFEDLIYTKFDESVNISVPKKTLSELMANQMLKSRAKRSFGNAPIYY